MAEAGEFIDLHALRDQESGAGKRCMQPGPVQLGNEHPGLELVTLQRYQAADQRSTLSLLLIIGVPNVPPIRAETVT